MPNTLAHIGIQTLVTRGVLRAGDVRWALVGVMVPDIPWIIGRVTRSVVPMIHDHQLWAYLTVQSSLAVSLLLCAALASIAAAPMRTFGVLSLNALLHLWLDASQAKWGAGVYLWVPFSWRGLNLGWFELESWPTFALTALGLAVGVWVLARTGALPLEIAFNRRRALGMGLLLSCYFAVPIPLRHGLLSTDASLVAVLSDRPQRTGRQVQFDRVPYVVEDSTHYLRTYVGERLRLTQGWLEGPGVVSARGTFVDDSTLALRALHRHPGRLRDWWSYIGLSIIACAWVLPVMRRARPGPVSRGPAP